MRMLESQNSHRRQREEGNWVGEREGRMEGRTRCAKRQETWKARRMNRNLQKSAGGGVEGGWPLGSSRDLKQATLPAVMQLPYTLMTNTGKKKKKQRNNHI